MELPTNYLVMMAELYNEHNTTNPIYLNNKALLLHSKQYGLYLSDELSKRTQTGGWNKYLKDNISKRVTDVIMQSGGKSDDDKKCAPGVSFKEGSCIDLSRLQKLVSAYNKEYPDNQIKVSGNKQQLVDQLEEKLPECNNQRCWIEQTFTKSLPGGDIEELNAMTFVPYGPNSKTDNTKWLDTININNVMTQYERKYDDFMFLGASPRDWNEINLYPVNIRKVDYDKLNKEGKKRFGVIFNLDKHNQGGSHWVAAYADHNKGLVYYFDSYGEVGLPPKKEIQEFLNIHYDHIKKTKTPKIEYNKLRHQRGGSECGMYSMYFIIEILKGRSFEDINKERIPDKIVQDLRDSYFY